MYAITQSYCEDKMQLPEITNINNEFKIPRRQRVWLRIKDKKAAVCGFLFWGGGYIKYFFTASG